MRKSSLPFQEASHGCLLIWTQTTSLSSHFWFIWFIILNYSVLAHISCNKFILLSQSSCFFPILSPSPMGKEGCHMINSSKINICTETEWGNFHFYTLYILQNIFKSNDVSRQIATRKTLLIHYQKSLFARGYIWWKST